MAVSDFGAPIAGNSLFTHKIGERPWERPVNIDRVEDAISFYMTSLSKEDTLDDLMIAIESGIAINPLSEALTLSQVMKGTHSLDVALLVKPVVMEFLAAVAESNDIDYKFSNKDPQAELDKKERTRVQMILQGALIKAKKVLTPAHVSCHHNFKSSYKFFMSGIKSSFMYLKNLPTP